MIRVNELKKLEYKKYNLQVEKNLRIIIKEYRNLNYISQTKLVNILLKLGLKEFNPNKHL